MMARKQQLTAAKLALLFFAVAFFTLGLVVIFSTTSAEILDIDSSRSPYYSLLKQFAYGLAGVVVAVVVWRLGFERLLATAPFLFWGCLLLLALLLIPGIGKEVNGARRWIVLGSVTFQPSELMKYLLPLYLTYRFSRADALQTFSLFWRLSLIACFPIILVAVEPNNGTAMVIGSGVVVLYFLARIPFSYWGLPLAAALVVGALFAYSMPYVSARLQVYLHPESDIRGRGHQPYQAKIAAGSGQLFGKGPGRSWQKLSYLPEAQNDYIAAIYAEEYGFIGALTLVVAFMLFAYLGAVIASAAANEWGFLVAGTYVFLITFQAFLNLAVVSGLLPSTGMTLPFFSQGGTSLITHIVAVAILMVIPVQKGGEKIVSDGVMPIF